MEEKIKKLISPKFGVRYPNKDVELAVECVCLQFRVEIWIGGLILEPSAYKTTSPDQITRSGHIGGTQILQQVEVGKMRRVQQRSLRSSG